MGLKTFWAQLSGQKIQEIPLNSSFDRAPASGKQNTVVYTQELDNLSHKSNGTRSRAQSVSRKRKSWFGGRPLNDDFIPAVPALNQQHIELPRAALVKDSYSKFEVAPEPFVNEGKRKSRRISLSRKASLRSIRNNYEQIEALPPVPQLPGNMNSPADRPVEQRKSRAMSFGRKSIDEDASKSKQRKRRSFWESSNPDNSEDESIPPVPALVRDGSQSPPSRSSRENRRRDSKHGDTPQISTNPGHRRTYTPRNAAAGFLMSTSGASEATRKSFRKSFHIADNDQLVCMTEEQRREWEKLKSLTNPFVQEIERYDASESEGGNKYANKQALAALEFGLR